MSKELVINVSRGDVSIALLENKELVELNREKKNIRFNVGDVYLAKVKKIMPGLNAAFVDVGYEKDAFLHYHDLGPQFLSFTKYLEYTQKKGNAPSFQNFKGQNDIDKNGKISQVLKTGQNILIQIAKEPISNKGPRLNSEISIAGRNIVLLPFSDKVSVSQKIESAEERNRLKQLLKSIKPKNYGVIVRTVAVGKKVASLDQELRQLVEKWESALELLKNSKPPQLITGELSRISATIRDILNVSFEHIYVNDEQVYTEIKDYIEEIAPEKKKIVKLYNAKKSIFEHFSIEKQIKALFGRVVPFKSGAYLIIEHTEALHVIDVNSGNRAESARDQESTALEVNIAAAKEISRQLRLRDMGGIIVIDFIDMISTENKQLVFERMKEYMAEDRTKHSILPLTKFGLMQITRQRVRPETNIKTVENCPTCKGTGEIMPTILFIDELENKLAQVIENFKPGKVNIIVHPFIYAYLTKGFFTLRYRWSKKYKCSVKVTPDTSATLLQYQFLDNDGADFYAEAHDIDDEDIAPAAKQEL